MRESLKCSAYNWFDGDGKKNEDIDSFNQEVRQYIQNNYDASRFDVDAQKSENKFA